MKKTNLRKLLLVGVLEIKKSKGMIEDIELKYKNGIQVYEIDVEERFLKN